MYPNRPLRGNVSGGRGGNVAKRAPRSGGRAGNVAKSPLRSGGRGGKLAHRPCVLAGGLAEWCLLPYLRLLSVE
jgi:hypothetical protein